MYLVAKLNTTQFEQKQIKETMQNIIFFVKITDVTRGRTSVDTSNDQIN